MRGHSTAAQRRAGAVLRALRPPPPAHDRLGTAAAPHPSARQSEHRDHGGDHAAELLSQGFTIVRNVLTAAQLAEANQLFDQLITPTTGKPVACTDHDEPGIYQGRRQLNAGGPDSGGLRPRLCAIAELPAVTAAAAAVMPAAALGPAEDGRGGGALLLPPQLMQSPIPASSFVEVGENTAKPRPPWRGHVDWGEAVEVHLQPQQLCHDHWRFGVLHVTAVEPGGGAFTVIPRSHRFVLDCIARGDEPLLTKMVAQEFYSGMCQAEQLLAATATATAAAFMSLITCLWQCVAMAMTKKTTTAAATPRCCRGWRHRLRCCRAQATACSTTRTWCTGRRRTASLARRARSCSRTTSRPRPRCHTR
eukprot:SAG22_NODE_1423_length_4464_cov_2.703551_1_plen_363_part_00